MTATEKKKLCETFHCFLTNGPNIMGDELLLNFGAKFQH